MEILFVPDKTTPKNYSSVGTSLVVEAMKLCLPMQAKSPVWDTKIPHASRLKSENIKQRGNHYKVKEDFLKMVHIVVHIYHEILLSHLKQ